MRLAVLALGFLCACTAGSAEDQAVVMPEGRDGPPPPMGTVTLQADGASQVLTTFDFSIGALDGSAWFGGFNDAFTLHLRAFPDADPDATAGVFILEATLPGRPAHGMVSTAVTAQIEKDGAKGQVMQWFSRRNPGRVEIETVTREAPESSFGHATGRFAVTLCDMAAPEKNDCHAVAGRFDTDVQFDNL